MTQKLERKEYKEVKKRMLSIRLSNKDFKTLERIVSLSNEISVGRVTKTEIIKKLIYYADNQNSKELCKILKWKN